MSTFFVEHQKPTAKCLSVLSPFLKHLNMGTLALIMFVALALLSTSHGKESETKKTPQSWRVPIGISALADRNRSEKHAPERPKQKQNSE
jgi:hypothetical protein